MVIQYVEEHLAFGVADDRYPWRSQSAFIKGWGNGRGRDPEGW